MALQIPQNDRKPLSKLLKLPIKTVEALQRGLATLQPRMRPAQLADDLAAIVADVDPDDMGDVVQALATLDWVRNYTGDELDVFVEEFVEAVEREQEDSELKRPAAGWEAFRPALVKLLSSEAIGVTAKALYVAYQHPRHFHSASVLTDARPVFGASVADGPSAFVISHTLRIIVHEDGVDSDWFASLNSSDLAKLRSAIDRAEEKEKSLRVLLAKTQKAVLAWDL